MLFFKRKNPPPLVSGLRLIDQASDIVMEYKRNKTYQPTEEDLTLFKRIEDSLWGAKCTAAYVRCCMNQRFNGEPEGSKKWRDNALFDYHYPP